MAPAGKQIVAMALVGAACGAHAFHAPSQFVGQRIVAPRAVAHASGECKRTVNKLLRRAPAICDAAALRFELQ
jgi:hypothetical protein